MSTYGNRVRHKLGYVIVAYGYAGLVRDIVELGLLHCAHPQSEITHGCFDKPA